MPKRIGGVDPFLGGDSCAAYARQHLGLEQLPNQLALFEVLPGNLHNEHDRFDLVYSWSVFEHIDQRLISSILNKLRLALKPDGLLFIQIAPLYYSPNGSHLAAWLPEPWEHLTQQHSIHIERLASKTANPEELASLRWMYETLNRLTAAGLLAEVSMCGFEVIRHYEAKREDLTIPVGLDNIYTRGVLLTEQIVLLLRAA